MRFFESAGEFRAWLEEHHETEKELVVGFYKKASGKPSMTWSESVDQALCFGWIDGRIDSVDAERYTRRFTPRRAGSVWSKVNIEKVAKLNQAGLMRPAGLRAFEARSEERSGVYSFEQRDQAQLTPEQERRLQADPAAWAYWQGCPPGYRKAVSYWVASAKREETRERRLAQLIEDSANGLDVKPLRR
jgi:uncharacterized protein YdeI (YjbR/CyaY-like superfamily)